jgi:transcriptional regulator of arginine metabolism
MSERSHRQEIILSVLSKKSVRTQEALLSELSRRGVDLTQSTLSRELKALGISKAPDGRGGYRYVAGGPGTGDEGLLPSVAAFVQSVERSHNLLIVKTPPGAAQGVARVIDQTDWPEVMGTLAGDDTILLICHNESQGGRVERRLKVLARRS